MDSVTFENERQRVIVTAEKKDKLTDAVIPGATFGLFAGDESHGQKSRAGNEAA